MDRQYAINCFREYFANLLTIEVKEFDLGMERFELELFPKGTIYIEKGKVCRRFSFIVSGLTRAWVDEEKEEVTTCLCSCSSIANSTSSFVMQAPSPFHVQMLEDCWLLSISYKDLNELYEISPWWLKLGKVMAEREFRTLEKSKLCSNYGEATEKYLNLMKDNPGITNRVPLLYIASYLGIRPETLSRIRKKITRSIS